MKIRNGFVSNSSSSSFIIQLKKPIEKYTLAEFLADYGLDSESFAGTRLYKDIQTCEIDEDQISVYVELECPNVFYNELNELEATLTEYAKKCVKELIYKQRSKNMYMVTYEYDEYMHDFVENFKGTIDAIPQ